MAGTGSASDSFAKLEELKGWFLQQVEANPPATEPLAADEWSLLQVIEHVVIVERGVLMSLMRGGTEMPKRSPVMVLKRRMVSSIMRRAIKVPVPVPEVNPGPQPDCEKLLAEWDKIRGKFRKHLGAEGFDPTTHVFTHPIAGPLSGEESVEFLANHLMYHHKRARKLLGG